MTEETTSAPPAQPEAANISVQDIFGATNVIKVAIERGKCFAAEEMSEVSALYNKLLAFCQFVQASVEAQSKAAAASQTQETVESVTAPTETVATPVSAAPVEVKKTRKPKK